VLLSSNFLSQVIGFAIYPILTRLYIPEAFGEFSLFLSIVGILTLLTTGKYDLAIVIPKSEKNAVALVQLSLILTGFFFIVFFIIIVFWKEPIALLFNQKHLITLLPYLPFYLLLGGIWQTLNYYFIRQKRYYNISIYNISQSVINSGLKCILGFRGFLQYGLVFGQFFGQLLATIGSIIAGKSILNHLKQWDKQTIVAMAKRYANFPKFKLPHGMLNAFTGNLPVLLLSAYFEMTEIGLFSLAMTIGFRPVSLFSNSVYQILFRKMSERMQNKENIKKECLLFCKICVIFILPFFILGMFIPADFFVLLFGSKWVGVGFYFKLLLPCLFLSTMIASLSFVPDIFSKQKTAMNIEFLNIMLRIISLTTGIYFHDFNLAIILYCCTATCVLGIKLAWYFKLINTYERI
jgi:O-antigen/teichoic acid export membrane protein